MGAICVKGLFITFEGPEGAGKSTQISRISEVLTQFEIPFTVVREPGGTSIGNRIRDILLDPQNDEIHQKTEILLYAASRSQLVEQVIRPALHKGLIAISDRYIDSSIAYQGYGAEWSIDEIIQVNQMAVGGLYPDRTYLLDLSVETGRKRIYFRGTKQDRIELKENNFHSRVREGYLSMSISEPERFQVINANQSIDTVSEHIIDDLRCLLKYNNY